MAKNKNTDKVEDNNPVSTQTESMLTVHMSEKYKAYVNKMDKTDQKQIEKAFEKFKQDPRSIKMKSLKLVCDSSTISMEINGKTVPLRVVAYLEKKGNAKSLTLCWAGTHPEYDKIVTRGFVMRAKLEAVPSKLYEGLTLGDLVNETNEYKSFLKKEEVLERMKNIGNRNGSNMEVDSHSNHKRAKKV